MTKFRQMRAELTRADRGADGWTDRPDEANRPSSRLTRTRQKITTRQKIHAWPNTEAQSGLSILVSSQLPMLFKALRSQFGWCSQLQAIIPYHCGLLLRLPEVLYTRISVYVDFVCVKFMGPGVSLWLRHCATSR